MRIALYPQRTLNRRQLHILFDEGIAFLSRTRSLKAAASTGMYERQWSKLCQHLLATASDRLGIELHMMRYPARSLLSTAVALQAVTHHLRQGRPVLLALEGRLNHWTVVVRFSDRRLSLFDSDGHRWILNSSVGVRACDHKKAYRIFARGIIAFRPGNR
ncbi:hypothetical protein ACT009_14545 [Sphingomonas sp. Tas61C01]|uniref:hypothetical protein n=1 Tax=Sphingomonas sp. Tas61C01 TaxID=3458297 RepID=UPI00403EACE8